MADIAGLSEAFEARRPILEAVSFATSPQESVVEQLAMRLADSMDNRSKPSLLMVSVHQSAQSHARRMLLWTFPQQEVFNLTVRGAKATCLIADWLSTKTHFLGAESVSIGEST